MKALKVNFQKVLICILACAVVLLPSFSSVKAEGNRINIYPRETGYGTFVQGSYNWVYGEAITSNINLFTQAMWVHIELQNVYNGQMVISISGLSSFANVGIICDGAQINEASLNQVKLQLYKSRYIDVYFCSKSSILFNGGWTCTVSVSNMTNLGTELTTENNIYAVINNSSYGLSAIYSELESIEQAINLISNPPDYQIPYEMLPAWILFSPNLNNVIYDENSVYPYISFTNPYETRVFRIAKNSSLTLYYLASTSSWAHHLTNSDFTISSSRMEEYQIAGYSLFKVIITNPTNSSATTKYSLDYSGNIIPIYFGSGNNISEQLRSLLNIESPDISILTDILNAIEDLETGGGLGLTLVNIDIDPTLALTLNANVDLYLGVEHDILSDYTDIMSAFIIADYTIEPWVGRFVWLKTQFNNIYSYFNPDYSILFWLPLVLGVIGLYIGRK